MPLLPEYTHTILENPKSNFNEESIILTAHAIYCQHLLQMTAF